MEPARILAATAAIAAAGWLASGLGGEPASDPPASAAPAAASVGDKGQSSGEVVLPRAGDGHFYADVVIDGIGATMLVDTGASVIALTGSDAEAIGLSWEPADVRPVGRGASGAVFGVPVTLAAVQLGDLEAEQVEAVIVPQGLHTSLLGQSFLSRIERLEIAPEEMLLGG